jgi:hypothetical protein
MKELIEFMMGKVRKLKKSSCIDIETSFAVFFAEKTPELTCEFSVLHTDVFVAYDLLGYGPVSLGNF